MISNTIHRPISIKGYKHAEKQVGLLKINLITKYVYLL